MHTLPKLSYEYDSLEPYFDKETMQLHHTKHHQAYIDKLNTALQSHPELQKKSVEDLLKNLSKMPAEIKTAIQNHGGGHYNHSFWWPMLKKGTKFSGEVEEVEVAKAIEKEFGGFDTFKEKFTTSALSIFGSGWTWLVLNQQGKLEIVNTPNQNTPLNDGKIPILGVDMWEHSFYIKHRANKAAYLSDFFNVINWNQTNENYKKARG